MFHRPAVQGLSVYLSPDYKVADRPPDIKITRSGLPFCLYTVWSCLSIINRKREGEKNRDRVKKKST